LRQPFFIALILLYASAASAHPGKTDYQDGHTCQKNCEEWDLQYGEYHLHDQYRNPIRLGSQRKSVSERMPRERAESVQEPLPVPLPAPEVAAPVVPPKEMPVQASVQGRGAQLTEEGMLQLRDIMLIVIAGLLVVVLLVLRMKKRRDD
jgi:hypothetical protein